MIQLSGVALAGIIFLIICICVLILVGINNINKGYKTLVQTRTTRPEQAVVWHRQPGILFGINNLVFALLLVFALCAIIVTGHTARYIFFGCIGVILLVSFVLVARTVLSSLQTVKDLQKGPTNKQQE